MEKHLDKLLRAILKDATIVCTADEFADEVLNCLDSLDSEYIDLENTIYQFVDYSDDSDDWERFENVDQIIEEIQQSNNKEGKIIVNKMFELRKTFEDIIFASKILIDYGIATSGTFNGDVESRTDMFKSASSIVRGLNINSVACGEILLILAGKASVIGLMKGNAHSKNYPEWENGASTVFEFRLKRLCNGGYSPELKQAKQNADERVFEYYRKKYKEHTIEGIYNNT